MNYDVIIKEGLLDNLSEYIEVNDEVVIITDDGIPTEYIDKVEALFENPLTLILPQGEDTKSIDYYKNVIEELSVRDYSRSMLVISLGGGVVGDLAGFVAATYLRGVKLIQIPTTLLSQVDSSVGSKVAVNHFRKNNVGAFYDPEIVLIDPLVLNTLSKRHFNNGMAEVIKMAFALDEGLLDLIDEGSITNIIQRCTDLKIEVVKKDKFDKGNRHILNFGHTIGHAIEIYSQFDILHGEAVAIGMMEEIDDGLKSTLKEYLEKFDLPLEYEGDYLGIILADKKIKNGILKAVKVKEIGNAFLEDISVEDFIKGVKHEHIR